MVSKHRCMILKKEKTRVCLRKNEISDKGLDKDILLGNNSILSRKSILNKHSDSRFLNRKSIAQSNDEVLEIMSNSLIGKSIKKRKNMKNTKLEKNIKKDNEVVLTQKTINTNLSDMHKYQLKKQELLSKLESSIKSAILFIPNDIRHLPCLEVQDALKMTTDEDEFKIEKRGRAVKRESIVSLNYGDQYLYDGVSIKDTNGKIRNKSLDVDLKKFLQDAKKLGDKLGKDLSLFINDKFYLKD